MDLRGKGEGSPTKLLPSDAIFGIISGISA